MVNADNDLRRMNTFLVLLGEPSQPNWTDAQRQFIEESLIALERDGSRRSEFVPPNRLKIAI
jgi:hypothetical protein